MEASVPTAAQPRGQ